MRLSDQALGAIMMALQKSLLEQSDIVPVLREMDFQITEVTEAAASDMRIDLLSNYARELGDTVSIFVTNPPVVKLEGTELGDAITELADE